MSMVGVLFLFSDALGRFAHSASGHTDCFFLLVAHKQSRIAGHVTLYYARVAKRSSQLWYAVFRVFRRSTQRTGTQYPNSCYFVHKPRNLQNYHLAVLNEKKAKLAFKSRNTNSFARLLRSRIFGHVFLNKTKSWVVAIEISTTEYRFYKSNEGYLHYTPTPLTLYKNIWRPDCCKVSNK